ncbi:DUF6146 family protein [Psychroserpens sp. XS_ASV72]|uniref:DUF6146 family protein n=1 Tax=Psychroserpens sp. XS_ASV72 TaxID=3241293 RepID=UPI00351734FF
MKNLFKLSLSLLLFMSCGSSQTVMVDGEEKKVPEEDIVKFSNEQLEYDIIIIEPGFNTWLNSMARPEGYYSQSFLETRNRILVQEWNLRNLQPSVYDPNLYQVQIDYQPDIDYGYDLNYKLYNYFIYFQLTYNQRLSSFVPRI